MDFSTLELSIISSFYFDQRSADTLIKMLRYYEELPLAIRKKIQFVLIDDCSKVEVSIPEDITLNFQLFRVKDDIAWNNGGARNLGVVQARTPKIILTDIDHVFPAKLLMKILDHRARKSAFYKFKRLNEEGRPTRTPRNLLYMTKSVFFDGMGYDEAFSGNYGFEDSFFIETLMARGNSFSYFSRFSKVMELAVDREKSYHNYSRDTTVNQAIYDEKRTRLNSRNPLSAHSRRFIEFQWEKVEERMIKQTS